MNNYAYLTLLSSDVYVYYVLALHDSWLKTKSKYPFYCIINEAVSDRVKKILTASNIEYIYMDTEDITKVLQESKNISKYLAFFNSTKKLKMFSLDQFDKCVYVDSDMIIYKNIDHLFDKPAFTAVEDIITNELDDKYTYFNGMTIFNGGFFVFEPSKDTYNKMLTDIQNLPDIEEKWKKKNIIYNGWNDQNILAWYAKDWLKNPELQLPFTFNYLVAACNYTSYGPKMRNIIIKHFIGDKISIVKGKKTYVNYLIYNDWLDYINRINSIITDKKLDLKKLDINLLIKDSEKPIKANPREFEGDWKLIFDLLGRNK